jgi:hypothetical protein
MFRSPLAIAVHGNRYENPTPLGFPLASRFEGSVRITIKKIDESVRLNYEL